jgi:hypothetical protein
MSATRLMSRFSGLHLAAQIRSEASDWNTTTSPSPAIAGDVLGPFADPPLTLRLTSVVVRLSMSRRAGRGEVLRCGLVFVARVRAVVAPQGTGTPPPGTAPGAHCCLQIARIATSARTP